MSLSNGCRTTQCHRELVERHVERHQKKYFVCHYYLLILSCYLMPMKYFEKAAKCLNACETPLYLGGAPYPAGTIFMCAAPYSGPNHPLFIAL